MGETWFKKFNPFEFIVLWMRLIYIMREPYKNLTSITSHSFKSIMFCVFLALFLGVFWLDISTNAVKSSKGFFFVLYAHFIPIALCTYNLRSWKYALFLDTSKLNHQAPISVYNLYLFRKEDQFFVLARIIITPKNWALFVVS